MTRNNCLSQFNVFHCNKQPKQKFPNGEKANLVSPDNTVRKLPTKTDLTQAPQTKLQTQHTDSMPTVSHEQTMTPSADPTQEGSALK